MTIEPQSIAKSNKNFLKGNEAKSWMVEEANLLNQTIGSEAGGTGTLHDGAAITTDMSINLSEEKWNEIVKKHLYTR